MTVIRVTKETSEAEKQARLEKDYILARLAALEAAEKKRNPKFRVPDPPAGYKRR